MKFFLLDIEGGLQKWCIIDEKREFFIGHRNGIESLEKVGYVPLRDSWKAVTKAEVPDMVLAEASKFFGQLLLREQWINRITQEIRKFKSAAPGKEAYEGEFFTKTQAMLMARFGYSFRPLMIRFSKEDYLNKVVGNTLMSGDWAYSAGTMSNEGEFFDGEVLIPRVAKSVR